MTESRSIGRLLPLAVHDGPTNMAIDESLLIAAAEGHAPLTLRFYGWDEPTVSLGYFQESVPPALRGMPAVRRLTGGGAIVHVAELTYSLVWRLNDRTHGVPTAVGVAYERINAALAAGLRQFGLDPGAPAADSSRAFLCFRRRSRYDLVVDGSKVAGSAQRRRDGTVLQHGSILVAPSRTRGVPDATVGDLVGRPVSVAETADAMAAGFREAVGWRLEPGALTAGEYAQAEALRQSKYTRLDWGGRRRRRAAEAGDAL